MQLYQGMQISHTLSSGTGDVSAEKLDVKLSLVQFFAFGSKFTRAV